MRLATNAARPVFVSPKMSTESGFCSAKSFSLAAMI